MATSVDFSARHLDQAQAAQDRATQRIASGKRVNSAADDAAAAVLSARLQAQLGAASQLRRNVSDAASLTDTASGALGQVNEALQRMRELALQANNATYSASDRAAIEAEYAKLSQTLDQQAGGTRFNGQALLDGSLNLQIQTSEDNSSQPLQLQLGDVSSQGLGVAGQSLADAQGARQAVDAIDKAISSVSAQQSSVGAAQAGLNSANAQLSGSYEALAASRSRRVDSDIASESADLSRNEVLGQAALKAVSLYQQNQASVLELLPKSKT